MVAPAFVIDASADLAFLKGESGGDDAGRLARNGLISAANLAEVVQRCLRDGRDVDLELARLGELGVTIVDVTAALARKAGELERVTKPYGLSLADRMCLALAIERAAPVLTSDKPFDRLGLDLEVHLFR